MSSNRLDGYKSGLYGERVAEFLLRLKGYSILERRYKTPVGEIDLIAQRFKRIVFVEVKYRRDLEVAAFAISTTQKSRIVRAANYWLQGNSKQKFDTLSLDVILVAPHRLPRHIAAAFEEM